jgi:hypothetical protein
MKYLILALIILVSMAGCSSVASDHPRFEFVTDYTYAHQSFFADNYTTDDNGGFVLNSYWRGGMSRDRFKQGAIVLRSGNVKAVYDNAILIFGARFTPVTWWLNEFDDDGWQAIAMAIVVVFGGFMFLVSVGAIFFFRVRLMIWALRQQVIRYKPQVISDIALPDDVSGLVGIRSFTRLRGILGSAGFGFKIWDSKNMQADELPLQNNKHGLYGILLGCGYSENFLIGIVSFSGTVRTHADGVVRAEYCRILTVICKSQKIAEVVSAYYGVPTVIGKKPNQTYERWLVSEDGIKWLSHNAEIIKKEAIYGDKREGNLESEIRTGQGEIPRSRAIPAKTPGSGF